MTENIREREKKNWKLKDLNKWLLPRLHSILVDLINSARHICFFDGRLALKIS